MPFVPENSRYKYNSFMCSGMYTITQYYQTNQTAVRDHAIKINWYGVIKSKGFEMDVRKTRNLF